MGEHDSIEFLGTSLKLFFHRSLIGVCEKDDGLGQRLKSRGGA